MKIPSRIHRITIGLCCLAAAIIACESTVAPLPSNATAYQPSAVYARWWAMTAACSGYRGILPYVRWYSVPGSTVYLNGRWVNEYWASRGNIIVIPDSLADYATGVRHEMLHALLRVAGHPRDQYLGACAGAVDCGEPCVRDAGPWSAPAPYTPAQKPLVLSAESTLLPLEADGQRWFRVRVIATNPVDQAVMVSAGTSGFGYVVSSPTGGLGTSVPAADSSTFYFGPRETKEWPFEFRVTSSRSRFTLPAGEYFVRGSFADRWTDSVHVTISP